MPVGGNPAEPSSGQQVPSWAQSYSCCPWEHGVNYALYKHPNYVWGHVNLVGGRGEKKEGDEGTFWG